MLPTVRWLVPLITMICWYSGGSLQGVTVPVALGIIQSSGEFRLDSFLVPGNATLFDGSVVETLRSASEIRLSSGLTMTLAPESRAAIHSGQTSIEKGVLVVRNAGAQVVHAGLLRISSADHPGARLAGVMPDVFEIGVGPPNHVTVFAIAGSANVRTVSGALVARVLPGTAMAFSPQTAVPNNAVKLTGCLTGKAGVYFVTDATSRVTVEVLGPNLGRFLDTRIEITATMVPGFTPAGGADHAVTASEIRSLGICADRLPTPPAGRGGSGNPSAAGSGAGGGLSSVGVIAIVGGVAVAGTVGGLAASGAFDGSSPASPK